MTKVAAMPIYGKNLKKSSFPEPRLLKLSPWVDLDLFLPRSNLVPWLLHGQK